MIGEIDPIEGNWYCRLDNENDFMVIDFNEEIGTVDIQYLDGDIEELDIEEWNEIDLEEIEVPENWTGPFDELEPGDTGYE